RRGIDESPEWQRMRHVRRDWVAPFREIFRPQYVRFTILLTALSATTIFAYWGLNLWIPAFFSLPTSQGGMGLSTSVATALVVLTQVGTFFGYLSFGFVADAIGRRRSFLTYILTGAVLILLFGVTRSVWALAMLAPLTTFFATGFFSGF